MAKIVLTLTEDERALVLWALSCLDDEYLYDDVEHAAERESVEALRTRLDDK